jgi:hypothetical protein
MNISARLLCSITLLSIFSVAPLQSRASVLVFSNATALTINDSTSPPTPGTPYPSSITVTGLTGQVVTKLTLTLHGLSHAFPSDITMLLVGPLGQTAIPMSEVGGQSQFSVTNLTLTLDDGASSNLPVFTGLTNGTFKPTNGYLSLGHTNLPYSLPAPAPAGNSNAVSSFSPFKNTDPSGVWKLFIVDDATGSSGSISGGWSLSFSVAVPLLITRNQTNVVISWPGSAQSATLQTSSVISNPGGWTNVSTTPVQISGHYYVTNRITAAPAFFRLVQP